ncbi:acyl-CoA dehydrogenase family protein [Terracoccus luteus]|jgi:alkylation response protein AidB-like acyl-CoA dehydrogenase|uniref:Alkylation response protein AidB-like acyl-CoA dehydrogenase n=1 Tax=Terracoccus luteus TaxID=53356 RepID=A0A839PUS3_9MICO|nr:acyl-CoA dehydrogenase family protein [Terracoccus luteus]MBB2986969.1 alkylation response protein AidB-like acyl-CoA dehydrogenase [Terracoccus luteus]MCP2172620.1 alkylation response protein AidB-like acyl-CoA dehydrogenase [Terracoccus luteus]
MPRHLYDADHEAVRASAREFVARTLAPRAEQMIADKVIDREVWRDAGKQGFFGFDIPEEFGGAGVDDYRFNAVVAEEMSRFNAATSSCFGIHSDVCPPYIVDLGTEEQKQRWLPGIASGDLVIGIAMTEPSGGSDLAALKTTAVRDADGEGWVLNGSKTFITNGYQADLVIVAARTDPSRGAKGITLFVVERGMPGFVNGRKLDKVGMPESDTAELFFEDVRVPDENRLGEPGMGFVAMMQRLPQERVGAAVSNVAHAKAILEETIEYAKQRKAFGQAIGTFQHNKFLLAELVTKIEVAEAYVDDCVLAHSRHELSAVDAAKAKWWSASVQNDVLDHCVQLHGGYGFMNEYRVARAWRDARVTKIWAGSNEIMKELIGRDLGL